MPSMTDPWRFVDVEDDLVADLLAGTIEAVLELGGWIHPAARFVGERGQFSVSCEADDGEPLLRLPSAAFIPITRFGWTADADRLAFTEVNDGVSAEAHELLILQTALHNACGKIPWLAATHPVLAPDLPPGLVDAVRAFRPSFRRRQPTPAGLFWSNRAFRLPGPSGAAEPMALPLVDLLDHAHGGATGTWTGDGFDVTVAHASASDECRLDYGLERDAIGMAVVYGFADETSRVAHSAPIEIEVDGVGPVRVLARGRRRTGELLPPVVTGDGDVTVISHLTFRPGGRTGLVESLASAGGWTREAGAAVLAAVASANAVLADRVRGEAESAPGSAAAQILAAAAARHADVTASGLSDGPVTESSSSSDSSGSSGS